MFKRLFSHKIENLGESKNNQFSKLVKVLKNRNSILGREDAAKALVNLGDKRAIEPFISILMENNKSLNKWALRGLGKFGDTRAVEALINVLLTNKDYDARFEAAEALGQLGDPRAVEPLIVALKNRHELYHDSMCRYSAEALIKIGKPSVEPLISVIKLSEKKVRDDIGKNIQLEVVNALGKLRDTRAVEPLIYLLRNEFEYEIRKNSARVLGLLGDTRSIESLVNALTDENWQVRGEATYALRKFVSPRIIELLINLVQNDENNEVRGSAATVLAEIDNPNIERALVSERNSNSEEVRNIAVAKIAKLAEGGDIQALNLLYRSLYDRSAIVQGTAINGLQKLGLVSNEELSKALNAHAINFEGICSIAERVDSKDILNYLYSLLDGDVNNVPRQEIIRTVKLLGKGFIPEKKINLNNILQKLDRWIDAEPASYSESAGDDDQIQRIYFNVEYLDLVEAREFFDALTK
jgi:HEAT repeat protein